ncbi:MAG: hypothetical protein NUK65_10805, partial [Firmicutes bacterium]|nr:hypothetical protein [Bacillota bacterium]
TVVVLADHILLARDIIILREAVFDAEAVCNNFIRVRIPYARNKDNLKNILTFNYFREPETFMQRYDPELPEWEFLRYYIDNDLDDIFEHLKDTERETAVSKYFDSQDALVPLLSYKIKELGEQYVLSAVYEYLHDENDTRDEVTFLYNLQ